MAADEKLLGALHTAVANALIAGVTPKEVPGYVDEETGEEIEGGVLLPSPAMLQAAAKFLKDNNVTCEPTKDNALGELEEIMNRRRSNVLPSKEELAEDVGFMQARLN